MVDFFLLSIEKGLLLIDGNHLLLFQLIHDYALSGKRSIRFRQAANNGKITQLPHPGNALPDFKTLTNFAAYIQIPDAQKGTDVVYGELPLRPW